MTSLRATAPAVPDRGTKAVLWRLGAIVLFLGLPLGAVAASAFALVAGLDASDGADHAEDTARAIVRQLGQRPGASAPPLDTAPLYLKSASASLAQAELQALVSARIETAGGRLVQLQPLENTDQDSPGRAAVEITFEASNRALLDGLHAVETGVPILTVPRLDAQAQPAADGAGGPGDLLHVTMTVQGQWKAPTP